MVKRLRSGLTLLLAATLFVMSACTAATPAAPTPAPATQAPAPTAVAPTQAPAPTAAPTQAPAPTAAPTQPPAPTAAPTAALPAGEIPENVGTYALPGDIPSLDPPAMLSYDTLVGFNVYETLTWLGNDGKAQPVLATDWTPNADATEWDFHLRKDVKFHDGTPLTAKDVKASLDRNIATGMVAYDFVGVETISVVDDYTIHIKCSAPRNMPLILSAQYGMFIYSAAAAAKGKDFFAQGNTDAGTGPYMIQGFEPGKDLVVTYYKDYRGGWKPGQFTKVIFQVVTDPTVRDQMIRSGQADLTYDLPFDSLASLKTVPGLVELPFQPSAILVAGFNMRFAPLNALKVRQALVDSFPYQQVQQGVYQGLGDLPKGFGPNYLWNPPADFPSYTQDLDKAKSLLAEAGKSGGFTLKLAVESGAQEPLDAAQLWQAELAKLNIKLDIQQLDSSAFWDYAYKTDSSEYNLFMVVATGDVPSPWPWLVDYTTNPNGWLPFLGYNNPDFDKLVFDAWAKEATDPASAHDEWVAAQRNLYDNAASVFIMDVPYVFVYRDSLVGLVPSPTYVDVVKWYDLSRKQ